MKPEHKDLIRELLQSEISTCHYLAGLCMQDQVELKGEAKQLRKDRQSDFMKRARLAKEVLNAL